MIARKYLVAAAVVALGGINSQAVFAGTRANDNKVVYSAPVAAPAAASQAHGPKGGFPSTPGLAIAQIKANDNAAFKRKSNGT